MVVEYINNSDNLRQGKDKINEVIDLGNQIVVDSANATSTSNTALTTANTAKSTADATATQLDTIILESGTSDAETIQARGSEPLLYNRLDKTDAQLAETANIAFYKVMNGEIDNTGVLDISAIIADLFLTHDELFLPIGDYKGNINVPNGKTLRGIKPIYSVGTLVNGTVLRGRLTLNDSKGSKAWNLGVISIDNGIEVKGTSEDIDVRDIEIIAANHAVLAEQNGGGAKNIKFKDCNSYDGIHGFVSKAENVDFINCKAYRMSANGFVLVSDNINGVTQTSNCISNNLINCIALDCNINLNIYGRDYTSETNVAGIIPPSDINISGGNLSESTTSSGIVMGDFGSFVGTGRTFLDPTNINILGVILKNNAQDGINIRRSNGVYIDACTFGGNASNAIVRGADAKGVKIGKNNYGNNSPGTALYLFPLENRTDPTVGTGDEWFKTANTVTTNIINFRGGKAGMVINILIDDDFTSLLPSGNLLIPRRLWGKGAFIALRLNDDLATWQEVTRSDRNASQNSFPNGTATINWTQGKTQSAQVTGAMTSLLFTGAIKGGETLTLMLWGNAAYAISGWDASIKWISKPTAIVVGKRIMMQFFYDGTNYWEISHQECAT